MPYIKQEDRKRFQDAILSIRANATKPGELNYVITSICHHYISRHGLNYTNLNEVIGALEAVKLEFYRKLTVPYEEEKERLNGSL